MAYWHIKSILTGKPVVLPLVNRLKNTGHFEVVWATCARYAKASFLMLKQ